MIIKKEYYTDCFKQVSENDDYAFVMQFVYNDDGFLIGNLDDAAWLVRKGITDPQPWPGGRVCSIGFNETEKKWYGWSHRAYYGFEIGKTITYGCLGFEPANKEDFIEHLKTHYNYEDFDYGFRYGVRFHPVETGVYVSFSYPSIDGLSEVISEFHSWPETWGKGVWTAKTLEDCKEMAIEFAKDVS